MLIAGHAISRNLILLTHNLKAEDWTKEQTSDPTGTFQSDDIFNVL